MLLKLHLFSGILYLASLLAMGGLAIPLFGRRAPEECMARVAGLLRFYHPFLLFLLGLLLMTGAFLLTDLKIALGVDFFTITFKALGLKLLLVFFLILYSTHQFFGVGLKLTRANPPPRLRLPRPPDVLRGAFSDPQANAPPDLPLFTMPVEEQMKALRRLQVGTYVNLALAVSAFYLGWTMR